MGNEKKYIFKSEIHIHWKIELLFLLSIFIFSFFLGKSVYDALLPFSETIYREVLETINMPAVFVIFYLGLYCTSLYVFSFKKIERQYEFFIRADNRNYKKYLYCCVLTKSLFYSFSIIAGVMCFHILKGNYFELSALQHINIWLSLFYIFLIFIFIGLLLMLTQAYSEYKNSIFTLLAVLTVINVKWSFGDSPFLYPFLIHYFWYINDNAMIMNLIQIAVKIVSIALVFLIIELGDKKHVCFKPV